MPPTLPTTMSKSLPSQHPSTSIYHFQSPHWSTAPHYPTSNTYRRPTTSPTLSYMGPTQTPTHTLHNWPQQNTRKDQFIIIKIYHSYLCTWISNNNITYAKWVSQSYIYQNRHANHNYQILLQYYHTRQTKHYNELIRKQFNSPQHRDSRFITPPIRLPLVNISVTECNPEYDIITTGHTIQVLYDSAYLYDQNGRHLHTIPLTRLKWL
jgi:hypothetical protein